MVTKLLTLFASICIPRLKRNNWIVKASGLSWYGVSGKVFKGTTGKLFAWKYSSDEKLFLSHFSIFLSGSPQQTVNRGMGLIVLEFSDLPRRGTKQLQTPLAKLEVAKRLTLTVIKGVARWGTISFNLCRV